MASAVVVRVLLLVLWLLRRLDYHINGSTSLRTVEEYRRDPYASYEIVRRQGPVVRSFSNRGWMILGFNEVQEALRNPVFSSDFTRNKFITRLANAATGDKPFPLFVNPPLLNQDPPNHTRLRKLASEGFINRYVQSLAPMIEDLATGMLDNLGGRDTFDIVSELAEPLPAIVIAEMMGVPEADRHLFLKWSHALTGATMLTQPALMRAAADAEEEMRAYFEALIAEKEKGGGSSDFISRLVSAQVDHESLTRAEVISTCILLLTAGHETTTRLIGNGLYTLMQHPDQLAALARDRSLLPNAIEEMLRYESPVQETVRFIVHDETFHGCKLKAGQMVIINFGAANRDPAANPEPNRFDITRDDIKHVAFGYGFHLCLGLALARLEARIVFDKLFDRYDRFECLDTDPPWQANPFFRGLDHLNIRARSRVRAEAASNVQKDQKV